MSIFSVLESNIKKSSENYSEYLSDKKGDFLRGSEFMLYALATMFKNKDFDDIEEGIVDSGYRKEKYDFGIDAIYVTSSNEFIKNVEDLEGYNEDAKFNIQIFQFKRGTGIQQSDILKLKRGLEKVFIDGDIKESDNLYFYNRNSEINQIKHELFERFSGENIKISCYLVFGGIEKTIDSDEMIKAEIDEISGVLAKSGYANNKVKIIDCQKLISMASKNDEIVDTLEYKKTFKYITEMASKNQLNGYISIVSARHIGELVKKHQSAMFEANIRDYFKRNDLNSKIIDTCSDENEAKYFWSYNNGLTLTCSKVEEMPNNKYKLYGLQVVNGCQTSNAIYTSIKNKERIKELKGKEKSGEVLNKREKEELEKKQNLQFSENTTIIVKIIETKDDELIYKITETTNSQTPIKPFSLKANDDIQKFIEKYLDSKDIAYERRTNSMRNKGRKNIINIQKLFQLYTAQILFKPSQVKTRPKDLFLTTYDDVFPSVDVKAMNYILYLIPIKVNFTLSKAIREFNKHSDNDYQKTLISYGKLHLGCFMLSSILKSKYSEKGIVENEADILSELENNYEKHFNNALNNFEKVMKSLAGSKKENISDYSKKGELDNKIVRFVKAVK